MAEHQANAELQVELFTADGTPLTEQNIDAELAVFLEESPVHDADIDWDVEAWASHFSAGTLVVFTGPAPVIKELAHWVSEETGELVLPTVFD